MSCTYKAMWFAPTYEPSVREVDLLHFTSERGYTAQDASTIADLEVGELVDLEGGPYVRRIS